MLIPERKHPDLKHENKIVFCRPTHNLKYLRERLEFCRNRRGFAYRKDPSVFAFSKLANEARGFNHYFMRRVFRFRDGDDPYGANAPSEAVSLASIRPGHFGRRIMGDALAKAAAASVPSVAAPTTSGPRQARVSQ